MNIPWQRSGVVVSHRLAAPHLSRCSGGGSEGTDLVRSPVGRGSMARTSPGSKCSWRLPLPLPEELLPCEPRNSGSQMLLPSQHCIRSPEGAGGACSPRHAACPHPIVAAVGPLGVLAHLGTPLLA